MIFNKNCFKTLFFPCKKITLNQQQILVERKISVGNTIVILTPNQTTNEINCNEWFNFPEIIYKKYHFAAFFEDFFEPGPLQSTSTFCEHGVQSFPGMECLKQAHYCGLWYQNIIQKLIARDQFRFLKFLTILTHYFLSNRNKKILNFKSSNILSKFLVVKRYNQIL